MRGLSLIATGTISSLTLLIDFDLTFAMFLLLITQMSCDILTITPAIACAGSSMVVSAMIELGLARCIAPMVSGLLTT